MTLRYLPLAPWLLLAALSLAASAARAEPPPPVTDPPATDLPATEPPATDLPATDPPPSATELSTPLELPAMTREGGEPAVNDAPLSEAELGNLGLDLGGSRVDTSFHFSGFVDFTSASYINPRGPAAFAQGRHQSFYIGNVNFYVSKNLSESFRTMGEVRFAYLPNGAWSYGPDGYTSDNTSTTDYANSQNVTRWGGIILQRVYLEWTLHRLVTVRGGQYLTPFGIWNVDHGSPAYIPVQRPYAIVSGLFPERQTGFEVFGRWSPSNQSTLGYHLTLSNGAGPVSEYRDLDRNKAVGWRGYWEHYGRAFTRLGMSGYYGRDTASTPVISLTTDDVVIDEQVTQSDNLTFALDLLIKLGGIHLQAEWIGRQRAYTAEGRTPHSVYAGPTARAATADTFTWAAYALAAYRFKWYGLTPFVSLQNGHLLVNNDAIPDALFSILTVAGGLNINPIDVVTFKAELSHGRFPTGAASFDDPVTALQFQAAWAF